MTDREMIELLLMADAREAARDPAGYLGHGGPGVFARAAGRLETLTTPPEGSPVAAEALADIRDEVQEKGPRSNRQVLVLMLRDLLAHADWLAAKLADAEAWCARLANDRENESARVEIGVARVMAALREDAASYAALARDAMDEAGVDNVAMNSYSLLSATVARLEERCGPASLPPHEVTAARLRRYEEAFSRLRQSVGDDDGAWARLIDAARQSVEGGQGS